MDEDEYEFQSSLESPSSKEADAFHKTAKKGLADKLRPIFSRFPKALVDTHGKDLLADAEAGSEATSGGSTPAQSANKSTPTVPSATTVASGSASSSKASDSAPFNTSVVRTSGEFASDAEGLFDVLTNEAKIPMWSRNLAHFKAEVGAEVDLFSGNIKGKVTKVERPNLFAMSWRAPTWPDSESGLTVMLDDTH